MELGYAGDAGCAGEGAVKKITPQTIAAENAAQEYDSLPVAALAVKVYRHEGKSQCSRRAVGILRGNPEDIIKKQKRLSGPVVTRKATAEELNKYFQERETDG